MKIRWRYSLWLTAIVLPVSAVWLPLGAQEAPVSTPATAPAKAAPPAAEAETEAEPAAPATGGEERVSADNNLSFPVDI